MDVFIKKLNLVFSVNKHVFEDKKKLIKDSINNISYLEINKVIEDFISNFTENKQLLDDITTISSSITINLNDVQIGTNINECSENFKKMLINSIDETLLNNLVDNYYLQNDQTYIRKDDNIIKFIEEINNETDTNFIKRNINLKFFFNKLIFDKTTLKNFFAKLQNPLSIDFILENISDNQKNKIVEILLEKYSKDINLLKNNLDRYIDIILNNTLKKQQINKLFYKKLFYEYSENFNLDNFICNFANDLTMLSSVNINTIKKK